jgi:hypothetical protein
VAWHNHLKTKADSCNWARKRSDFAKSGAVGWKFPTFRPKSKAAPKNQDIVVVIFQTTPCRGGFLILAQDAAIFRPSGAHLGGNSQKKGLIGKYFHETKMTQQKRRALNLKQAGAYNKKRTLGRCSYRHLNC